MAYHRPAANRHNDINPFFPTFHVNNWYWKQYIGILLAIHTPELNINGKLHFGPIFPLKYDIMGPFSVLPFLECRHSVQSMRHFVQGRVYVNEQEYLFQDAFGLSIHLTFL